MPKSGDLTSEEQQKYDEIIQNKPLQYSNFSKFLENLGDENQKSLTSRANHLGFNIDFSTGQVSYSSSFKALELPYDLCYVRHGKTEGNTEPRVYQGQVDYKDNQLTSLGIKQAEEAADKMDKEFAAGWVPDIIIFSPLNRAIQTGEAFSSRHPEIPTQVVEKSAEMAFGSWDNVRVIDLPCDSIGHLFYLDQNALVSASRPHVVQPGVIGPQNEGNEIPGENFIDVLERVAAALVEVGQLDCVARVAARKARVLMYGHSMAGAAASMLLGHGKVIGEGRGLGFDGKYIMANATPAFLPPLQPNLA